MLHYDWLYISDRDWRWIQKELGLTDDQTHRFLTYCSKRLVLNDIVGKPLKFILVDRYAELFGKAHQEKAKQKISAQEQMKKDFAEHKEELLTKQEYEERYGKLKNGDKL